MDQEQLNVVRDYLEWEFRGCTVEEKHDFDRGTHEFTIDLFEGVHLLRLSEAYLASSDALQIVDDLRGWDVAGALRMAGENPVLLEPQGPLILDENY